jgi:opacity protein-like surface antigen
MNIRMNPMKKTQLIVAAAAAILASSIAFAADEPPKFGAADTNGDGVVDEAEFKATGLEAEFKNADTDGNGSLNKEEYTAVLEGECA